VSPSAALRVERLAVALPSQPRSFYIIAMVVADIRLMRGNRATPAHAGLA
jgi:hypothetical protein